MTTDSREDASISQHYAEFYAHRNFTKVYPVEFVVRTLLGSYPDLKLDRRTFADSKILDLGFGDGRNMPLLHDLGFTVHGVEISQAIADLTRERMLKLGVPAELKVGSNSEIPFGDDLFDFVLACHSSYYVLPGETFADNLHEIARVLRPNGRFIFSLAKADSYILKGAEALPNGLYRIAHDPYQLRNGGLFRAFASRDEIVHEMNALFENFSLGLCENDYYGIYEKVWIGTCLKRNAQDT